MIDNYQAGKIRSTKNLSGGESYIVSLTLAFGLSYMVRKNVRVDLLFLDEGFDSQDEEALDTALEFLQALAAGWQVDRCQFECTVSQGANLHADSSKPSNRWKVPDVQAKKGWTTAMSQPIQLPVSESWLNSVQNTLFWQPIKVVYRGNCSILFSFHGDLLAFTEKLDGLKLWMTVSNGHQTFANITECKLRDGL